MAKHLREYEDDNLTRRDKERRESDVGGNGFYVETETSEGRRGPNLSGNGGRGFDPCKVKEA